jgi:hypothetical protein
MKHLILVVLLLAATAGLCVAYALADTGPTLSPPELPTMTPPPWESTPGATALPLPTPTPGAYPYPYPPPPQAPPTGYPGAWVEWLPFIE